MSKKILLCICFCLIYAISTCQIDDPNFDEILKLHQKNMRHMYMSRGAPPRWLKGNPTFSDLTVVLNGFYSNKKVGILFYQYSNDTLFNFLLSSKSVIDTAICISQTKLEEIENNLKMSLGVTAIFENRVPQYRGAKVQHSSANTKIIPLNEILNEASQILLPFGKEIIKFDHIIIVPTLNIGSIPFSVLKLENNTFLIDNCSYSVAPSLFEICALVERNKRNRQAHSMKVKYTFDKALLIGNPLYPKLEEWYFPNLPGAEKEVKTISQNFTNPDVYYRDQATKVNVLENIESYDLIYLATHGIADAKDPLNKSFIVLAGDSKESSFLTAKEVQDLRTIKPLNKALVVLSACQTGLGKSLKGGTIGLTRAFQIAGASHVVMSLWSVDDLATAKLMSLFIEHLQKTELDYMPFEALRLAIIDFKKENPDPSKWASFSIFGIPF